jgi:hypothetical protein
MAVDLAEGTRGRRLDAHLRRQEDVDQGAALPE